MQAWPDFWLCTRVMCKDFSCVLHQHLLLSFVPALAKPTASLPCFNLMPSLLVLTSCKHVPPDSCCRCAQRALEDADAPNPNFRSLTLVTFQSLMCNPTRPIITLWSGQACSMLPIAIPFQTSAPCGSACARDMLQ